jgi:hypothetical protein
MSAVNRRVRRVACVLSAALALTACGAAPAQTAIPGNTASPSPSATSSTAPTHGLTQGDLARLEEVWHLLGDAGPGVWAGWGADLPPFLLKFEADDAWVGHASPPDGFEPVPAVTVADQQVYARAGHLVPGIGVQQIGDQLGVALLPRDGLQALVDEILGPGAVTLDDVQYVRWAAHEAFHVYQMSLMNGELPRFGFEGNEMEMVGLLAETDGLADQLAGEARLLNAALAAEPEADLRDVVAALLAARAQRRLSLPEEIAGFEQAVEWSEGLARYSDVRLLQAAGGSDYRPSPAFSALGVDYPDSNATWTDAVRWLDDLASVPGTFRDRYYELGAAQAYLLDRLTPGWHARALPGGESLESLLVGATNTAQ